jgi:hypothetical protein
MNSDIDFDHGDNVISLAAIRQRRFARLIRAAASEPCPPPGRHTVFFITGGEFEAMVNGSAGILSTGDFVRVPDGAAYGFTDIGLIPGTLLSHRFAIHIEAGFLRELAAAMPRFARVLPRRGTVEYARLKAIARRWGVSLDSNEAA